jgi:hypothetical protein
VLYAGPGRGGSWKMARVGGKLGLGTITKDQFVCRFDNVGRSSAKEGLGTLSRVGMGGKIGE